MDMLKRFQDKKDRKKDRKDKCRSPGRDRSAETEPPDEKYKEDDKPSVTDKVTTFM